MYWLVSIFRLFQAEHWKAKMSPMLNSFCLSVGVDVKHMLLVHLVFYREENKYVGTFSQLRKTRYTVVHSVARADMYKVYNAITITSTLIPIWNVAC